MIVFHNQVNPVHEVKCERISISLNGIDELNQCVISRKLFSFNFLFKVLVSNAINEVHLEIMNLNQSDH